MQQTLSDLTLKTDVSVSEILSRISVRRPYFAFDQLKLDVCAGDEMLWAPISREQPMGTECGVMAAAEIGRHLAILGSCAAARKNENTGQHYYLAWDAHLREDGDIKQMAEAEFQQLTGSLVAQSRAEFIGKREAIAESQLVHQPSGQVLHHLTVKYQVLSKKVFERTFSCRRKETPDVTFNPYASDLMTLGDVFVLDDLLSANLVNIDPCLCAGHFPAYPALPVAILAKILIGAAGKLFGNVIGIENAPYRVVEAIVSSEHLAFTDDRLHIVIQHKDADDYGPNMVFRCRALSEGREQHPFGDLTITLRSPD